MSVTSGKFFGDKLSYVGGAPRSNGKGISIPYFASILSLTTHVSPGQVIFYSKAKPDTLFNVEAVLNGEQFGSSFGYTLASVDLNGDK